MDHKFLVSIITPLGPKRSKNIPQFMRDMYNQRLDHNLWENVFVHDGFCEENFDYFTSIEQNKTYNWRWYVKQSHDPDELPKAVGGTARNHALGNARGKYVVFFDDDDRYRDDALLALTEGLHDDVVNCIQMTITDQQMYRGSPKHWQLCPYTGEPRFPIHCQFGTPCMIYKREWALARPWPNATDNDFLFCQGIMDKFRPRVVLKPGFRIDVKGQVIGSLKDWITVPPFHRGD